MKTLFKKKYVKTPQLQRETSSPSHYQSLPLKVDVRVPNFASFLSSDFFSYIRLFAIRFIHQIPKCGALKNANSLIAACFDFFFQGLWIVSHNHLMFDLAALFFI